VDRRPPTRQVLLEGRASYARKARPVNSLELPGAACHHWGCHRVLVPKPAGKLEQTQDLLRVLMLPTLDRAERIGGVPASVKGPDP
jgi:hypothetical protein